ncbi:DEAD/DEAH box helicase [Paraflavitalea sp. CAU 1676]|uniref:DEAD/DEAH box helicase n=1 Tax=Paraflavitalea sp. CAU 1676 TaxID=3032598 RepID=UPI0023DA0CB3|nr:DEAD/DEAH box helicase [Paraflavitalea sp. CAU 1676]MDF2192567.1 helicase-related protein [Paraflavitalea sp. CAU 1676]
MRFANYDIAKDFIIRTPQIDYSDSFDLAKLAGRMLRDPEKQRLGRDLVIRAKDALVSRRMDERTSEIWNELLVAAGLYPYVDPELLSPTGLLRYQYHKSDHLDDVFFHEEQLDVSMLLQQGRPVILSGPTSYGKSLLIENVVASRRYKNIVIIQPTLALLDETRKKLTKYREQYRLLVSTSQEPDGEKGNIFLFTGERVVEYDRFPKIDFFVIDEFYKLSMERGDDRAIILNQALYKLLKQTRQFYMLGPYIKGIPDTVKEKLGATWTRTDFATVAVDERMLSETGKKIKKALRKQRLFELLQSLQEPALVYTASPATCTELAIDYSKYIATIRKERPAVPMEIREMNDWIAQNVSQHWSMIEALNDGIGFHHGALPRHLGSSIVDAFNNRSIKVLFCTATLIEGVNTSAKHVILFDKKKGRDDIDFFDYKNISGRSGRMKKHYVGDVIRFENEPPQLEFEVDIPIISQENAPLEILLAIDQQEIQPALQNRLEHFQSLDSQLQEVLKKHSTVSIDGQLAIIQKLERAPEYYHTLLRWQSNFFLFDELAAVIELAWDHLAVAEDKKRVEPIGSLSARWLTSFAYGYNRFKSVAAMINDQVNSDFWRKKAPDYQTRVNHVAFSVLQISRNFFDYKLPKWLTVIEGLQAYVFNKYGLRPGNYTYFASQLENGFLDPNLAALREYDIPITAIRKLQSYLADYRTTEQNILNLRQLREVELVRRGLLPYEIRKLQAAF